MDPEQVMMGAEAAPPMGAPPEDPNAMPPDQGMPDMDPGELAAMLGQDLAQQRAVAHQMVDQAAEQQLQQIIQMVMQGAQGAGTLDGSGAMAA